MPTNRRSDGHWLWPEAAAQVGCRITLKQMQTFSQGVKDGLGTAVPAGCHCCWGKFCSVYQRWLGMGACGCSKRAGKYLDMWAACQQAYGCCHNLHAAAV